jgi:hypothetical protein
MHVLILGARAPACLEWARAFRVAEWEVTVADSLAWPLTRSSSAVDRYLRVPEPRGDTTAWLNALEQFVTEHDVDLIIPTCEEVFYLAHGLPRLARRCRVFVSEIAVMHRLHHKFLFSELAAGLPINAPETVLLETADSLQCLVTESRDWVFKPAYSRFANRTLIRPSARSLCKINPSPEFPWVAQRFVHGREYCTFSLLEKGKLRAHACYHPAYRVGAGAGIYFEPVDSAPIRNFLEQFGEVTSYTGQVGFDFIKSPAGQYLVLECNPRATSGIHLFDNQAQALVDALVDENAGPLLTPAATPRMVAFAMLLFAAPRRVLSSEFWRDYAHARDVISRAGDRGPLRGQLLALLEIGGRAISRRRGLLAASTVDIEWDGQSLDNESS